MTAALSCLCFFISACLMNPSIPNKVNGPIEYALIVLAVLAFGESAIISDRLRTRWIALMIIAVQICVITLWLIMLGIVVR